MELITSGISHKLNEKVSKKQFLKESGIFLLGIVFFPSILEKVLNNKRLRIEGNKILLDNEILIERREE